jgi:hypothetical protein
MSELGLSLQKRKSDIEEARTLTLNVLVDECKARMRENGEPKRARRRKPETAKADLKPPLDEVGHCDHCLGTAIRMSSEELQRPTSDFRSGLARGAFHAHGAGKLKHTA